MEENNLSYAIRGAIFRFIIFLDLDYLNRFTLLLWPRNFRKKGLKVRKEVPIPVWYQNEKLELGFRIDLLVEEKVLV